MARRPPAHGRLAVLSAMAFIVLVVVLTLLGYFGLPDGVIATTLGGVVLVAVTAIGVNSTTMQTSEFYLAGRSLPAPVNGMASAAAMISAAMFLGLAGGAFSDAGGAAAVTVGVALGFLILGAGLAPYFRKSAAFGVADFLGIRYGGRGVRIAAAVVVVAALFPALVAAITAAALMAAMLLKLSAEAALTVVTAAVLASTVLGGLRAVTRTAVAQYGVLTIAFLVPLVIVSMREFSLPLPQLTFGFAAKEAALLALASGNQLADTLPGHFDLAASGGSYVVTMLVLAAGVAALPHLLLRSATVRGPDRARRSAAWALLAVLVIAVTAPAYAAFVRLILLREIIDGPLESLPAWIFTFGNLGLVRICGVAAVSVDAVLGACSALPGFTGNLHARDLAISGDAIVLAGPSIFGQPFVGTALVAVGGLAATLATAAAAAFALASAIGHDLYAGAVNTHASAGRQLILTRLVAAGAIVLAAWLAAGAHNAFTLAPIALALSAAGLFPALILAVWWKRANASGAVAGIVAGGVLTATLIADSLYPGFLPFGRLGFSVLTTAIVGMPLGFVVAIAVSLLTQPPTEEQQATLDAIRRPGGTPFVQESESL